MFRRRTTSEKAPAEAGATTTDDAEPAPDPAQGKGRPTPKRREAERRRRTYVQAPQDRKQAARMMRERQSSDRQTQSRALRSGDETKLPPRDAGPVRRLVRDVVDSRRGVGGYFLFTTLGVLLIQILLQVATSRQYLTPAASAQVQVVLMYVWYALIALVAVDSYFLVRRMNRIVRERHPDHTERGLTMYAVMRSLQIRRLRLPKPKVGPGAEI
ncbi:MAG: DUF3043 domain-containing protein [Streptosporangiales bacterium]|nr:DUF3043 domain-containing protein [Streptosporangiales bacterium]MBO0889368.1 DUF3043 domain-containing protein [Acidothermales bacterium]